MAAAAALLAACGRGETEPAAEGSSPGESATLPALPAVDPPLDRAGLLLAVGRAASDFASGSSDAARQRELDGRRFAVALRFGCPNDESASRISSFDETTRVLRVRIEPDLTARNPLAFGPAFAQFEAVEGFQIRRPWLLRAACPAVRAEPGDVAAVPAPPGPNATPAQGAAPVIGLAHFFTEQDSRTLRRANRAYQATVKLAEDEQPSSQGYDLVLSGRLAALPDGRVIACMDQGPEAPPACVVSVSFDRVALQRPDGTLVAAWTSG